MPIALNDYASSGEAFKFVTVGDSIAGVIVRANTSEQDNYDGDGKERVLAITVDTGDGERGIYARLEPKADGKARAISDAVAAHGGQLTEGGTLKLMFSEEVPASNPKHHPFKRFTAEYAPPATSIPVNTSGAAVEEPF